jgi:flagellar M-ring protein FliF
MEQVRQIALRVLQAIQAFRAANRQTFNLIVAAVVLAVGMCAGLYVLNPGALVVLASNLSAADRTALSLRLRRQRIDYTLGADSISVPSNQLAEARSLLEGSPGFSGGAEDFSLFDRSTMGESDFDEQVNYQRSLQGEIERTLMDIHGIDSARVMLAMGNPSPFGLGPPEAAHAAVMLTVAPGAIIDASMARAIAHLVAGSVRGLSAENVTISGNDGAILYPIQHEGELGEAIRLRNDFERRLQEKVAALLSRIMGEDRYAVEVAVDVDTSRVTSSENLYGNGSQAILSEEHSVTPAGMESGGIPGLTSNLPTPTPAPTPQATASPAAAGETPTKITAVANKAISPEAARKDIVNYKPSVRQIRTITAPVRIKRITVAAVLDGTYEGGHFKPLPDERLAAIKGLVAAAVGVQPDRGDSVDVQSAALSQPYVPPVPNPVTELRTLLNSPVRLAEAAAGALAFLILLLFMLTRAMRKLFGGRMPIELTQPVPESAAAAPDAEETAPLIAGEESSTPPPSEFETIRLRLNQEIKRNPAAAAEILRKWLSELNSFEVDDSNKTAMQ